MKKEVVISFDEEAEDKYQQLKNLIIQGKVSKKKPTYSQLLNSIDLVLENLRFNPFYGDLIPRRYIPKKTIEKYGTDKIFRVELVGFWRLLYTLEGDEIKILIFVLEFTDHKDYNKIFQYKKR
ncbi:hypothetical protein HOC80_02895 [archaeon]|mgnify:FL=1|jgi:hypothetical protein|nr:hypothetical protein [archaeon]MBT4417028.1 hypothetical protein [archaeon]